MRILRSWPFATLLVGIAALMGINAASKGHSGQTRNPSQSRNADLPKAASNRAVRQSASLVASQPEQVTAPATLSSYSAPVAFVSDEAKVRAEAEAANTVSSAGYQSTDLVDDSSEAYLPVGETQGDNADHTFGPAASSNALDFASAPPSVDATSPATTGFTDAPKGFADAASGAADPASEQTVGSELDHGWSASETTRVAQALPKAESIKPQTRAAQCGKCERANHKGDCPTLTGVTSATGSQQLGAVAGTAQCQELSAVTSSTNGVAYEWVPLQPQTRTTGAWIAPGIQAGAQAAFVATPPATAGPNCVLGHNGVDCPTAHSANRRSEAFAMFGPHAALVQHLTELHEQLGELRGEASLRESVIAMSSENASMATQLEAMKGHHELMEQLVQQTIELTRMRAEQQLAQTPQPPAAEKSEESLRTVATDATAQQARLDDLRRENQQLRVELEAIRGQLQAMAQPLSEPKSGVTRY